MALDDPYFIVDDEEEKEKYRSTEEGLDYARKAKFFLRYSTYCCCIFGFIGIFHFISAKKAGIDKITSTGLTTRLVFAIIGILVRLGIIITILVILL